MRFCASRSTCTGGLRCSGGACLKLVPILGIWLVFIVGSCGAAEPAAATDTNTPAPVVQLYQTNLQEILRACWQLRDRLEAAQISIEQNRQEVKEANLRSAEVLSNGLQNLQRALTAERAQELAAIQSSNEALQRSNRLMLIFAGVFAGMGLLALCVMSYFQWRTSTSLSHITASLPMLHGLGPGASLALGLGDARALHSGSSSTEQSNLRLLGAIEQLEKRIHDLEQKPHAHSQPEEGRVASERAR